MKFGEEGRLRVNQFRFGSRQRISYFLLHLIFLNVRKSEIATLRKLARIDNTNRPPSPVLGPEAKRRGYPNFSS